MLLTHGARSVLWAAKSKSKTDKFSTWAVDIHRRRGHNKASIAVANKMARIVWAVWKHGKPYGVRSDAR
jgi:transposase